MPTWITVRRVLLLELGVLDLLGFLVLYNAVGVEWAWIYVFSVTGVFGASNVLESLRQMRAARERGVNGQVEFVTVNLLGQEAFRLLMVLLWVVTGVVALLEITGLPAIWTLFAGAFAMRANTLLSVYLRRRLDRWEDV